MSDLSAPTPEAIRAARAAAPNERDRDFAERFGISEAQLLAAHLGHGVQAIDAHPDRLIPAVEHLGTVMALTRNAHCVIEIDGPYHDYHSGEHAAMVLAPEIDLRIFPKHWVYGFAVEKPTDQGVLRSLQVFDAAGDAIHKIYLRQASHSEAWDGLVAALALPGEAGLITAPRQPVEGPKTNPDKAEILRKEWAKLTDTHQFLRLASKLKMNRLGAYHLAGEPFARALTPQAANTMLETLQAQGTEIMLFVGNRGCIEIYSGPIGTLRPMGPWQNVLDPGFNLHLRQDRIAELWAVDKPTSRGKAVSVEAFDAEGELIFQIFGIGKEGRDSRPAWQAIVDSLPSLSRAGAL